MESEVKMIKNNSKKKNVKKKATEVMNEIRNWRETRTVVHNTYK